MSFQELKLAILKHLQQNQQKEYIEVEALHKIFKKSSYADISIACKRLIEENLICEVSSVIVKLQEPNTMHKIKIAKDGIEFLMENESSETGKESNKINRKILYATVATVLVSIITIIVGMNFDIILPKKIDLIGVQITNETSETIKVNNSNAFYLWLPAMIDAEYVEGKYEFIEVDGIIEVLPTESIFLEARILNTDRFYDYYKNEDCDITLWIRVNGKLFKSNSLRFSKKELGKYYTEFIINE